MEAVEMSTVMEDLLPVPAPELPSDRFLDRELSWLAFNNRVLDLAKDAKRVPLLERAKFLAIFSSNLDEFYMVRVAGLKRRIAAGVAVPTVSGMMPREVHLAILNRTRELVGEQAQVFHDDVRPGLAKEGIEILRWDELTGTEKDRMDELFAERIFPVLTPLAVDPSHPFPYISGLSINLAVLVRNPETGIRQFARVKVPTMLARFIPLAEGRYVALEDVIAHHLDQLFSGMQVVGHHTFRVTRTRTSRWRRTTPKICCSPWRRRSFVAGSVGRRYAWRSRTTWTRRCSTCSSASWTSAHGKSSMCPGHLT